MILECSHNIKSLDFLIFFLKFSRLTYKTFPIYNSINAKSNTSNFQIIKKVCWAASATGTKGGENSSRFSGQNFVLFSY